MSDQEKKSGGSAIGSSVVMVEQTTGSRHKQPYRPNELQYDTEPHHKHPRAPAVPSVAEELKQLAEESTLPDSGEIKDRTECDYEISADKHKQSFIENLSSNTERSRHSPETITLAPIEAERKKGISTPLPRTLPSTESDILEANKEAVKKTDHDSINDEITELQTPEMAKKHSEWCDIPLLKTKKEISWDDKEYQETVALKAMASKPVLERRGSVTPCFRSAGPYEGPSGISICLPQKSSKYVNQPSGISINISKKYVASKSKLPDDNSPNENTVSNQKEKSEKVTGDASSTNFIQNVLGKFNDIQCKIKSYFK